MQIAIAFPVQQSNTACFASCKQASKQGAKRRQAGIKRNEKKHHRTHYVLYI
jgi:hypothetical protein